MMRSGCTSFSLPLDLEIGENDAKMALVGCDACTGNKRVCGPAIACKVGDSCIMHY